MDKPKPKLTPLQLALVKNLVKGMSLSDAAIAAGYSENNARQSGYQALTAIREKAPQILDKHGLSEDALIDKYLRPALDAQETEFAKFQGQITDSRDVVAWGPRLQALDMAFNLHGSYAAKDASNSAPSTQIVVVNQWRTTE